MSLYRGKKHNKTKQKLLAVKHLKKIKEEREDLDNSFILNYISAKSIDNDSKSSKRGERKKGKDKNKLQPRKNPHRINERDRVSHSSDLAFTRFMIKDKYMRAAIKSRKDKVNFNSFKLPKKRSNSANWVSDLVSSHLISIGGGKGVLDYLK